MTIHLEKQCYKILANSQYILDLKPHISQEHLGILRVDSNSTISVWGASWDPVMSQLLILGTTNSTTNLSG